MKSLPTASRVLLTMALLGAPAFALSACAANSFDLNQAILNRDTETVKGMLDQGANPNKKDSAGRLSLIVALGKGVVVHMRQLGGGGDETPAASAPDQARADLVRLLLDRGADPNKKDNNNVTPLNAAIRSRSLELVKLVLDKGADPTRKDKLGYTPLDYAFGNGTPEIIKLLLLDKRIDPNKKDDSGSTPLAKATVYGNVEVVGVLLDRGADVNADNPLGLAAVSVVGPCKPGIVKLLLTRGAAVGAGSSGSLLYLCAAAEGDTDLLLTLFDKGLAISPNYKNLVLSNAEQSGHPDAAALVKFLIAGDQAKIDAWRTAQAVKAGFPSKLPGILEIEKAGDELAGKPVQALERYLAALREVPPGMDPEQRLCEKAIKTAFSMDPPPILPEEARRRTARAQAFVEKAKDEEGYRRAAEEFSAAIRAAPWLPSPYYNLSVVQEKLGDFAGAMRSLKLYLLAKPDAPDAKAVQTKIYKLEADQELAK